MNILETMETTLSFDVSKDVFPEQVDLANLPIVITCPAYEKIVGWTTCGEIKQNGGNATAILSATLCEKNELLLSRLVAGIKNGDTKISWQAKALDCYTDAETGFIIVGQLEVAAIVLCPKAYERDGETDGLFEASNNDTDNLRSRQQ